MPAAVSPGRSSRRAGGGRGGARPGCARPSTRGRRGRGRSAAGAPRRAAARVAGPGRYSRRPKSAAAVAGLPRTSRPFFSGQTRGRPKVRPRTAAGLAGPGACTAHLPLRSPRSIFGPAPGRHRRPRCRPLPRIPEREGLGVRKPRVPRRPPRLRRAFRRIAPARPRVSTFSEPWKWMKVSSRPCHVSGLIFPIGMRIGRVIRAKPFPAQLPSHAESVRLPRMLFGSWPRGRRESCCSASIRRIFVGAMTAIRPVPPPRGMLAGAGASGSGAAARSGASPAGAENWATRSRVMARRASATGLTRSSVAPTPNASRAKRSWGGQRPDGVFSPTRGSGRSPGPRG